MAAPTIISGTTLTASGGAFAVALRVYNGTHSLANVTASGSGATETYAVYSGYKFNTPTVSVHQSRLSGATNSVFAFGGGASGGTVKSRRQPADRADRGPCSVSGHVRGLVQRQLYAAVAGVRLI